MIADLIKCIVIIAAICSVISMLAGATHLEWSTL